MNKIIAISLLCLFLTACGQTGSLYLPAKTTQTTQDAAQ